MFRARLMLMTALAAAPASIAKAATDITAVPTAPRPAPTFSNINPLPQGMMDSMQCNLWSAMLDVKLRTQGPAAIAHEADDYLAQCERNTPMS